MYLEEHRIWHWSLKNGIWSTVACQRNIFDKGDGIYTLWTSWRRPLIPCQPCAIFDTVNCFRYLWVIILFKWMCYQLFSNILFWCHIFEKNSTYSSIRRIYSSLNIPLEILNLGIKFCVWLVTMLCRWKCFVLCIGFLS